MGSVPINSKHYYTMHAPIQIYVILKVKDLFLYFKKRDWPHIHIPHIPYSYYIHIQSWKIYVIALLKANHLVILNGLERYQLNWGLSKHFMHQEDRKRMGT